MALKDSGFPMKAFFSCTLLFPFAGLIATLTLASCKPEKKESVHTDVFYTCSMHPQIMESKPGSCPICNMDLIPVQKGAATKSDEVELSDQQMQLGAIHVDTIGRGNIDGQTVLTATINYDQQKLTSISSKVKGRIEKLYYKNAGDYIEKGTPLMEIYSEDLNNAKQEYVQALERQRLLDQSLIDFDQLINSAKTKLLLWGMSESQIEALAKNHKTPLTTTVYSAASGSIIQLSVQEGVYITEGGPIVQLADLSALWAEAQVYASQFSLLSAYQSVTVQIPDIGKEIEGKSEFVNPEINPDKRINLIRVTIPNQGGQLKPGMSAYVVLKSKRRRGLSLPIDAVLRDEKGASVWLQTGKNTFKNKMVKVGMESGDRIEITDGLKQGAQVATGGAYLINSEYVFKKGSSPMTDANL